MRMSIARKAYAGRRRKKQEEEEALRQSLSRDKTIGTMETYPNTPLKLDAVKETTLKPQEYSLRDSMHAMHVLLARADDPATLALKLHRSR